MQNLIRKSQHQQISESLDSSNLHAGSTSSRKTPVSSILAVPNELTNEKTIPIPNSISMLGSKPCVLNDNHRVLGTPTARLQPLKRKNVKLRITRPTYYYIHYKVIYFAWLHRPYTYTLPRKFFLLMAFTESMTKFLSYASVIGAFSCSPPSNPASSASMTARYGLTASSS